MKPIFTITIPPIGSWHCAARPTAEERRRERMRRMDLRLMSEPEPARDDRQPVEGRDERD